MQHWEKILVTIQVINGSARDIKLELNNLEVIGVDNFLEGENIISVPFLREHFPGKFEALSKINFVARNATSGSLNMKMSVFLTP